MIDDRAINEYVNNDKYRRALNLPKEPACEYFPLAQGEYNANYYFVHPTDGKKLVLRVNHGSQMHLDNQIEYEAHALKLMQESPRTPVVYYVDGSASTPGNGILVMEHLPGRELNYEDWDEMSEAAACLADIHSIEMPENHGLIAPEDSLRAILDECEEMLAVYMESDIPDNAAKTRLRILLDSAWKLLEGMSVEDTYRCCINTELNSTNFLVDNGYVRLVDWEKPLYGDPAQDLGHFLAPTTTFWKTDVVLDEGEMDRFIDSYIEKVDGRFDVSGLKERVCEFVTITCLRGITWCAMAWVQYQDRDKSLFNESTRIKLNQYLDDKFLSRIERIIQAYDNNM